MSSAHAPPACSQTRSTTLLDVNKDTAKKASKLHSAAITAKRRSASYGISAIAPISGAHYRNGINITVSLMDGKFVLGKPCLALGVIRKQFLNLFDESLSFSETNAIPVRRFCFKPCQVKALKSLDFIPLQVI